MWSSSLAASIRSRTAAIGRTVAAGVAAAVNAGAVVGAGLEVVAAGVNDVGAGGGAAPPHDARITMKRTRWRPTTPVYRAAREIRAKEWVGPVSSSSCGRVRR